MSKTLLDLEITPEVAAGWGACWSRARLDSFHEAVGPMTLGGALADDRIDPDDRVWLGCAALARHDRPRLVAFARGCADSGERASKWASATRATDAAWAAAGSAAGEGGGRARQLAHLRELCAEVAL